MLYRLATPVRALLCLFWLALLLGLEPAHAQTERILDYHSDITVFDDSSLQVTETITVFAAGNHIRHGIYRDFPTTYTDPFQNRHVVGFTVLSATRDAAPETMRVQEQFNGKRIYLGNEDVLVPQGRHAYTITYTTNRQIGFFEEYDQLFWNVTGEGWDFPIDHSSATVHLPSNIAPESVTLSGFTGPQGSRETKLTTSTEDAAFLFTSQRALAPHEGLSIILRWPKGFFTPPTFAQNMEFFFRDNRGALLLVSGFLVTLLYYLIAWSAVGRDPARGVIMALYDPPSNLSPAAMRCLIRMGYDNKAFVAAILDMAVRGYLKISEQSGTYTLTLTGKDSRILTPDEKQIAAELFEGRSQLILEQDNHALIQSAMRALRRWLKTAEEKIYFVKNSRYLLPALFLSLLVILAYFMTLEFPRRIGAGFLVLWIVLWSMGVSLLLLNAFAAWREVLRGGSASAGRGKAIFLSLFSIPFLFFELVAIGLLAKISSLSFGLFLIATGLLHGVFVHLMKAPTFSGRRLMDQVEGFKLFLSSVDGDRLNRMAPPQQTPQLFEKFLPYALALDVENAWAQKFSGILTAAGSTPASDTSAYAPSFYSGAAWNSFDGTSFASSFGNSFSSAISSSSTAPGSGGGGGSGGSGGGGGGGGGGGW